MSHRHYKKGVPGGLRTGICVVVLLFLASCASKAPQVPYPVYIHATGISDTFLAGFPGTRAKVYSEDVRSRRASIMLQVPSGWSFGTGA